MDKKEISNADWAKVRRNTTVGGGSSGQRQTEKKRLKEEMSGFCEQVVTRSGSVGKVSWLRLKRKT